MTIKKNQIANQVVSNSVIPLPVPADPNKWICVEMMIPDSLGHRAAFLGAISNLATWRVWQRDLDHNAAVVADLWKKARRSIRFVDCNPKPVPSGAVVNLESLMSDLVRVICDDSGKCVLQYRCDVCSDWITAATLAQATNPGQPSGGTPQPLPGGSPQCYDLKFSANSLAYLPTNVSAGDTLTISAASGAGNGSTDSHWKCVDGLNFALGACIGGTSAVSGSSPAPSLNIGELVALIDGTYYEAKPGSVITVPGGVSNAPVVFQGNWPLSGASGSYEMSVCVQNNQTPPVGSWCRFFDFTSISYAAIVTDPDNDWVAGLGWNHPSSSGDQSFNLAIGTNLTLTDFEFVIDHLDDGTSDAGFVHDDTTLTNPGFTLTTVGTVTTAVSAAGTYLHVAGLRANWKGIPNGYLRSFLCKGTGTPPSVGVAC